MGKSACPNVERLVLTRTPRAHEGIILAQTKEKYDFLQINITCPAYLSVSTCICLPNKCCPKPFGSQLRSTKTLADELPKIGKGSLFRVDLVSGI